MKELNLEMKMKYINFLAQHPLGKEYNKKLDEQKIKNINQNTNKKRLG